MYQFEIIDDEGVIYSGDEDFIMDKWEEIKYNNEIEWKGDLKLVKVLDILK